MLMAILFNPFPENFTSQAFYPATSRSFLALWDVNSSLVKHTFSSSTLLGQMLGTLGNIIVYAFP